MLAHEREFFDTLKTNCAKAAFKAMLQDCNDAIRGLNDRRLEMSDPGSILHMTVETQKQRALLRQEAMCQAARIDAEFIRTKAGMELTWAHLNKTDH